MTLRTVGICRFSYLGDGGFKSNTGDRAAVAAKLYDPARLEERFRLFEAITLPCIAAQTDPDFTFLIVTGKHFPDSHLARLKALTAPIPQCQIVQYPPRPHRMIMKRAINHWRGSLDAPCLQFRLDDDDAMALTFVEQFKQTAHDLAAITARHSSVAVDFNQGYVFTAGTEGVKLWPYSYPYSAIALGMIVQAGSNDTIMSHGHQNLWKTMPTMTFPAKDMMMRGHNDFNDSRLTGKKNVFDYQPMDAEQAAHIKRTFGIDDEHVQAVFSRA
ncbi:putative rhamnosyl transferase [uncultured Sulfitobacter sp.]|uniref:putative rhamnosyl transferase n=1 Tax=uncultured Sulfitobacter sp. TaxID=191468 RepID=UPI0026368213|nr:putative rhamnosyl transferase [uncultured Sulfitobacter sp.]